MRFGSKGMPKTSGEFESGTSKVSGNIVNKVQFENG